MSYLKDWGPPAIKKPSCRKGHKKQYMSKDTQARKWICIKCNHSMTVTQNIKRRENIRLWNKYLHELAQELYDEAEKFHKEKAPHCVIYCWIKWADRVAEEAAIYSRKTPIVKSKMD